jgi:glucose-6-phosphate 1-dehydrogenase
VWNAQHVARVEIVFDETLGLEGRAGYYDRAGALRDMVQNHLLQLLSLVAMEPPASLGERDLRDRERDVLRAVRTPQRDEAAATTVRARYTAGRVGDRELPAYVDEEGVDPTRGTETLAEVRLHVDNWRWAGVPFVLRSGKALSRDRRCISVTFRPVPHLPFDDRPVGPDVLRLNLNPDRIAVEVNLNGAGDPFDLERAALSAEFTPQELPPYSQVLAAVLSGDPTLSIRGDEAEECWRIIEPVLEAWAAGAVPLREYPAGSDGPHVPMPADAPPPDGRLLG